MPTFGSSVGQAGHGYQSESARVQVAIVAKKNKNLKIYYKEPSNKLSISRFQKKEIIKFDAVSG